MTLSSNALIVQYFPRLNHANALQKLALVFVGTLCLTLSAKIQIPIYPIKTSMQSFVVIFLGCLYGRHLGILTVALYLFEGLLGLPVFQGTPDRGVGISYMVGPTAGYLFGFLMAIYGAGALFEKGFGKTPLSAFILFTTGSVLIDIPGVGWLTYLMGWSTAKAAYLSYQTAFLFKAGFFACVLPLFCGALSKMQK